MYRAIFLMLTFVLASCVASTQWVKDGASSSEVQKAKLECEFEAAKHDVSILNTTWQSELNQARLINMCMKSKGYSSQN